MLKYRHSKLNILATLLGIFILITFLQVGVSGGAVYAAAETTNYDNTDVMADLESMTIGDNRFDAADYPANPEGSPQILAFVEYCYSYYADSQDNYALYVYVYNPAQLDIKSDRRNQIQFSAGNSGSNKYPLTLLSTSSDKLYYKFKVELTASEKNRILSALDNDGRTYDINGVELYTSGSNADDYAIEKLFTYSGYAAGYGADEDAASTLTCTAEGGTEVIPITAHHTTWYPEGSKPGNTDLQESLHSVYFAVPKEYDEKYDYLEAVKVQWLNARTIPVLVTGNSTIYSALQELNSYNSQLSNNSAPDEFDRQSFNYILATDYYVQSQPGTIYSYYVFNDMCFVGKPNEVVVEDGNTKELKTLFWFLPTDVMDYTDRADNYITPSSVILDSIQNLSNNGYFENDKAVAGKYPSYLFESWDNQFHQETIEVGKSYTLSSEIVNNGWWEKFWGYNNVVDSDTFKNIRAIQEVETLTGNAQTDCANYYIGESDYNEFYDFYYDNRNDCTIYLLRFATSDRYQKEVTQLEYRRDITTMGQTVPVVLDTNAYFFQTNVYLDFDIIEFQYSLNSQTITIPVVMSPIDIFPQQPPPVYVTSDSEGNFWLYAAIMIATLIVFYVVYRIINKGVTEARQENATAEMAEYAKRRNSNARKSKSKKE